MSHRSVAESIEQDGARSAALAAAGSNAFSVMLGAAPKQWTCGPKTLQAFVDGHWQLQFTVEGGVMCICCAWAAQTDCPGVKGPPKAASAFVNGTYGIGMRMMMAGPKTWRKDVLEGDLGVSRGTTSSRRKIDNPAPMDVHMRSPMYTSTKRDKMATTASVIGTPRSMPSPLMNTVMFSATLTAHRDALGRGARKRSAQCTRKLSSAVQWWRPISERILLHCTLTSKPGHHASRRWIVEKAMVAMHGAMQDGVSQTMQRALFIALLFDGCDRQRPRINEYAILLLFLGTGPGGMCEVFLGVVDVASREAQEVTAQVEAVLLSWIPDRAWWAQKVVAFDVDGASNLGVRGANARQAVDVLAMEHNIFEGL